MLLLAAVASQEGSFICCAEGDGAEGLSQTEVLAKRFRSKSVHCPGRLQSPNGAGGAQ